MYRCGEKATDDSKLNDSPAFLHGCVHIVLILPITVNFKVVFSYQQLVCKTHLAWELLTTLFHLEGRFIAAFTGVQQWSGL